MTILRKFSQNWQKIGWVNLKEYNFCCTKAKRRNLENCNFTGEAKNELSAT